MWSDALGRDSGRATTFASPQLSKQALGACHIRPSLISTTFFLVFLAVAKPSHMSPYPQFASCRCAFPFVYVLSAKPYSSVVHCLAPQALPQLFGSGIGLPFLLAKHFL